MSALLGGQRLHAPVRARSLEAEPVGSPMEKRGVRPERVLPRVQLRDAGVHPGRTWSFAVTRRYY
jgi:hypothetical protein